MKPLRAADVRRVVGAAGEALTAALETRSRRIEADMLNSAGSVSAEWYVETLWHYLFKRNLLQGVSSLDVVFKQPARPSDKMVHFALPRPEDREIAMAFHVRRRGPSGVERVPVPRGAPVDVADLQPRPAPEGSGRGGCPAELLDRPLDSPLRAVRLAGPESGFGPAWPRLCFHQGPALRPRLAPRTQRSDRGGRRRASSQEQPASGRKAPSHAPRGTPFNPRFQGT